MSEVITQHEFGENVDSPDADEVFETIIDALADAADVSPMELDPIYDSIDPDALSRLMNGSDADLSVTFTHGGHNVQVYDDGMVIVRDSEGGDAS
jgi:hypothetical protein